MKTRKILLWAFVGVEAALYVTFLTLDLCGFGSISIKYASVALCFFASAAFLITDRLDKRALVCVAMLFTLAADLFLLVLGENFTLGVALFCVAQGLYAVYINFDGKNVAKTVILRICVSSAAVLCAGALLGWVLLYALAAIYFVNAIINIVEGFLTRQKREIMLAVGLILLAMCDICVGIFNLGGILAASFGAVGTFALYGMWAFYLPSQVVIALSNSLPLGAAEKTVLP